MKIPIAKPFLGQEEADAAREVILSGWVTQGPKVLEFEKNFASLTGAQYACAVSSCTTALHLALLAVGVGPGDVVITVSHSFIATANAIRHCGAEPIFLDIDPKTYNIDAGILRRFLDADCTYNDDQLVYTNIPSLIIGESPLRHCQKPSGRIAAILAVHQMGMPCDIIRILNIASRFHIPVIEDAACAVGSQISNDNGATWQQIGSPHGEVACFSFHPRKVLTTGDGGMLTTNNQEIAKKMALLRQHGMSISDSIRHSSKNVLLEEYVTTGFNYRMTDIQAAIGIEQLKKLPEILSMRRELAWLYVQHLKEFKEFTLPSEPPWAKTNWQSYPVRIDTDIPQERILQHLLNKGITTRRGIMNAHQEKPYLEAQWNMPNSEKAHKKTILLPLYCGMVEEQIIYIKNALQELFVI